MLREANLGIDMGRTCVLAAFQSRIECAQNGGRLIARLGRAFYRDEIAPHRHPNAQLLLDTHEISLMGATERG